MPALLVLWSHLLAALLYGALAVFQLRRWNGDPLNRPLTTAFVVVSIWTIFLSMLDNYGVFAQLTESARNLAFLAFMYGIMQSGGDAGTQRSVKAVYAAVAAVVGLQIVVGGVISEFRSVPSVLAPLISTSQIIGLTIASGSLILVHNLYGQAAPSSRNALRFPMLALAAMWAYDLHLYSVAYFTRSGGAESVRDARRGAGDAGAPVRPGHPRHVQLEAADLARRHLPVALADRHPHLPDRDDVGVAGDGDGRRRLGSRGATRPRFPDDPRGPCAAAVRPGARLAAGDRRQACLRASLRLSRGMAALHRHGRPTGRGQRDRSRNGS